MTHPHERSYVLGTHDAEVERLAFQHSVWQEEVHRAWRAAGIARGSRVVDVGAGPGFASIDLARLVGDSGEVLAAERSARFLGLLAARCTDEGLRQVRTAELDLMETALPAQDLDAAWCRWVACFVPDPARLVDRIACALRPGGVAIFHEYVEYDSYQLVPDQPEIRGFVQAVYESWRAQGGEPDIARILPPLLVARGFALQSARPIGFAARPVDRNWRWPAGFVRTNVPRLVELGVRDAAWGDRVLAALEAAERDPASVFVTPTVLEIVCTLGEP